MRFLVSSSLKPQERARPPVRAFLCLVLVFLAGTLAQRYGQGILSPAGVAGRYLGAADDLGPGERMPWATVLEEAHLTSFFAGVLLLSLGSLVIASRLSSGIRRGLIAATFVAAVADVLLPLAVVATGHGCTLRAASSFLSVGLFAALALVALIRFGKAPR